MASEKKLSDLWSLGPSFPIKRKFSTSSELISPLYYAKLDSDVYSVTIRVEGLDSQAYDVYDSKGTLLVFEKETTLEHKFLLDCKDKVVTPLIFFKKGPYYELKLTECFVKEANADIKAEEHSKRKEKYNYTDLMNEEYPDLLE